MSSPTPELDLKGLISNVQILGINFFEQSASRADVSGSFGSDVQVESNYSLQTGSRDDLGGFRVRVRIDIELPGGAVRSDAAIDYALQNDVRTDQLSKEVMSAFVNDVAVMHLVPYLRQSVADLTQRVFGVPLLIPIVQRGELEFELEPAN